MYKRQQLLLIFICLATVASHAQERDTLVFAKDRVITSLFGTISTQQVGISDGTVNTTGYTLGTNSGIFIKDNWVVGVNFSLSKSEYINSDINIDSEDLLLGLWSRLYFAQRGAAALYVELTPYYTAINRRNVVLDTNGSIIANEEIFGNGFGLASGFGFTYIVNRNVGFGMTLSYSKAKLNVNQDDLLINSTSLDSYFVSQLQLSFNFQIYLDQFFF